MNDSQINPDGSFRREDEPWQPAPSPPPRRRSGSLGFFLLFFLGGFLLLLALFVMSLSR